MEVVVGLLFAGMVAALVYTMRNPSAVTVVEVRRGKKGRYRWVCIDALGMVRTTPTRPAGWSTSHEAEMDGLAVYPRAVTRTREDVEE